MRNTERAPIGATVDYDHPEKKRANPGLPETWTLSERRGALSGPPRGGATSGAEDSREEVPPGAPKSRHPPTNLTEFKVGLLKPDPAGHYVQGDTQVPSFGVRVRPSGH
jgi:hypothetical protein